MGFLTFLSGRKKLTASEIQQINTRIKILQDSLRIIQKTENLDTFFSRYDVAENAIREIGVIAGENNPCVLGETPKECLNSLMEQKESQTNNCIDRYIRKETKRILGLSRGRIKSAKGVAAILDEYGDQMTDKNMELARMLCKRMMDKIEKLEED